MLSNQKIKVYEEVENLKNENSALKRAVESKSAAIGILRTELEECQRERDEFRTMAETHPVSQPIQSFKILPCPEKTHSAILSGSENTLAQLLSHSKEENKQLKQELTDMRCRLHDAQSDLKILRAEKSLKTDIRQSRLSIASSSQLAVQERETHIQQLEQLTSMCQTQENDISCLLEEREELIKEREEIRHKRHRLNHVLNVLLSQHYGEKKLPRHRTVDLDAIITENRYLQQRMKQLEEEKILAIANASKYKSALESCRTNPNSLKHGISDNLIMSPKQVSEFLKQYEGEIGESAEKDLRYLCIALVDSLNQKSRAVKTQKATNKMLIERVGDLERRLVCYGVKDEKSLKGSDTNLVSISLMEGYNQSLTSGQVENLNLDYILKDRVAEENSLVADTEEVSRPLESNLPNASQEETEVNDSETESTTSEQPVSTRKVLNGIQQSSSDSEEIVPLENLDSYISNLKQKRLKQPEFGGEVLAAEVESVAGTPPSCPKMDSSDTSFDIDISDYDSDDDNLELALQNWQSEFEKTSCSNIISKLSPKRSVSRLGKDKNRREKIQLPDKLKQILK